VNGAPDADVLQMFAADLGRIIFQNGEVGLLAAGPQHARVPELVAVLHDGPEPDVRVHRRHPSEGECAVSISCNHIDDSVMSANLIAVDNNNRPLVSARNVRVQYAPVNQLNATYRDKSEFTRILAEHKIDRQGINGRDNASP